jgi:hypothetical protein
MPAAHKSQWFLFGLTATFLLLNVAIGAEIVPNDIVGSPYVNARASLLARGFTAVLQNKTTQFCNENMGDVCNYPELSSCAIDAFTPCRFEWKSTSGVKFYVVTRGGDKKRLIVVGVQRE